MTLDIRGSIKYNPDVKPSEPQYVIECKSPFVSHGGSGNLNEMIEDLIESVRNGIVAEFGRDAFIEVLAYKMNLTIGVSGIVNRTLTEFAKEPTKTEADAE